MEKDNGEAGSPIVERESHAVDLGLHRLLRRLRFSYH